MQRSVRLPGQEGIPVRNKTDERLILFTRYPGPGKVKSRLIPTLGPENAAALQRLMTEHAIRRAKFLHRSREIALEVRYDGASPRLMKQWLGRDLVYKAQGPGKLGDRMLSAFSDAFRRGTARVVIVGSDCPQWDAGLLAEAFDSLKEHDLVLGPAMDGGYYLIGLSRHLPPLFRDISWGTERVLDETRRIAQEHGLSVALLERLHDVDRLEDVPVWKQECLKEAGVPEAARYVESHLFVQEHPGGECGLTPTAIPTTTTWSRADQGSGPSCSGRISVIIPTLNEVLQIGRTLESVRRCEDIEVIVVDGGSVDGTPELAQFLGATVLTAPPGRGRQMNAGAARAAGEILLFLHADTLLPEHWDDHVKSTLAEPGTAAGAFEIRLSRAVRWGRIVERLANFRSRVFQLPYGDQALFLRADVFRRAGRFPEWPIMEDFEFIRRLRKGGRIRIVPVAAVTSARRWEKLGVLRTTIINQVVIVAYLAGVSPAVLARLYHRNEPGRNRQAG